MADQPAEQSDHAGTAADHVSSILSAAEAAAERIRDDAERRLAERVAEAERAAGHRVQAAEEEAVELVAQAETKAAAILADAQAEAAAARAEATSEALTTAGRAQENADAMLAEAREEAERVRAEAEERARVQLRDARGAAEEVRSEGMELVANLREMGSALRSNADRLLRDVQAIHSRMVAQIERADPGGSLVRPASPSRGTRATPGAVSGDDLDVPEFIAPS